VAITYDGALYTGPETDTTSFYSCTLPSIGASTVDFAVVFVFKVERSFIGSDPSVASGSLWALAGTSGVAAPGGNDFGLALYPANAGTAGNKSKLKLAQSTGGQRVSTAITNGQLGTTQFAVGDVVVVVFQSIAGTVTWKTCKVGAGTVTTEATGARNASWSGGFTGAWTVGKAPQSHGSLAVIKNQGLTDAEILSWASGTDPESIVTTSANRLAFWHFDQSTGSLASLWGTAAAATKTGTGTAWTVGSPLLPNAASRLSVTNEPVVYGPVSINDDGTDPTWTVTGTYTGYTPTALQVRVEKASDSTDVVAWTDLGSFSASAGTWSGTVTVPAGGTYRLQVRDKTTTTIIWKGAHPFNVCPMVISTGQSPYVLFETSQSPTPVVPPANSYLAIPQNAYGIYEICLATGATPGAGIATAMNTWSSLSGGLPIIHQQSAVTGTSSTDWATEISSVWPNMLAALDYLKPQRVLIQWINGAADNGFTASTIKSNHTTILADLDADLTTTRGIAYRYKILPHNRDTGNANSGLVRTAQREWVETHANFGTKVLLGPGWLDMQTNSESTGTVAAATSTTFTLASTDEISTPNPGTVLIVSGTGAGQTRTTSAFNSGTKVVTISSAWTTIPDTTSVYVIVGPTSPHPIAVNGCVRHGTRHGYGLAYSFGKSTITGIGPTPTSATYPHGGDGSILDVKFTHRHGTNLRTPNGGTSASRVAGFGVKQSSTALTITSAVITAADTVRLTLSAVPTDKTQLTVSYADGLPISASHWADTSGVLGGLADLLFDDAAPTGGLPAQFTYSDAPLVPTEAPAASTGVLISSGFFVAA
jgi:hypothetical protein